MSPLPLIRIHPAHDAGEIVALSAVLCATFEQDAHFNWLVRQDRKRNSAMRQLFELMLTEIAGRDGVIQATSDLKAVAIWFPPGASRLGLATQLRAGLRFAAICGWHNLPSRAWGLNRMEARHPKTPHYFLQTIGVHPMAQGQGRGAALLARLLQQSDSEGIPVYLETANPGNLRFYEKRGFNVIATNTLPRGPLLFRMLRTPRP